MKSLIARCVIGGLLLSPAMAAAFDPPVDRCNNVPDKELFSCLKPILDAMDTKPIRNAAGQTLFEEVMSKKPLPSGNDAQALERQRAQRERLQSEIHANTSDISSGIEADLENALKAIITRCKSSDNVDTCILTKVESKRSFYEAFLDKTAPAAWPDVDIISFSFFHVTQKIAQEQIRCNALESSAKQSCLEQIPTLVSDARDEARHILIGKGTAYGNRQAAERNTQDRQRQQEYAEAQREQELERARIQALSMFLGSGGFKFSLPAPYQPPPVQPVPTYRPPVNFMTNVTGSQAYTSCY